MNPVGGEDGDDHGEGLLDGAGIAQYIGVSPSCLNGNGRKLMACGLFLSLLF
jgi:hypothetical protein